MSNKNIKEEFAKVILNAKIAAGIFFILLTPSIVMIIKDRTEVLGQDQDFGLERELLDLCYIWDLLFLCGSVLNVESFLVEDGLEKSVKVVEWN